MAGAQHTVFEFKVQDWDILRAVGEELHHLTWSLRTHSSGTTVTFPAEYAVALCAVLLRFVSL